MKSLYIFDLDGTLSKIDHRLPILSDESLDENERWRRFFAACIDDEPNDPVCRLYRMIRKAARNEIWIWTGRSSEVRVQTHIWLHRNHLYGHSNTALKMREEGDKTKDADLKQKWLYGLNEEDRGRIVCCFEDRSVSVEMWRRNGILCLQVADGNF